jgi:type I restriction enzyme, S subunit
MTEDRYQSYQETPVKWLKKIPSHWEVRKLKFFATIRNGQDYKNVEAEFGESSYPVFGSGGAFTKASQFLYDGESVLFGRKGTIDKPLHVHEKFWTVDTMFYSHFHANTNGRYFYYQATTIQYSLIATQTALPSITQFDLSNYFLCFPPPPEQTQIARFLDYKTAQLDQLIAKKQALIECLNEQRIALITQAVTRGLNPDAALKDSGVEWLGQVPEGWEVKRLRFVIRSNPVKSEIRDLSDTDIVSFVPMEAIGEYGGIELNQEKILEQVYTGYTYFKNDDVIVAKITPCFENGKGALARNLTNKIAFGTTELHVLRSEEEINPEWLFYLSISYPFREIGASEMYGAGGQKRVPEDFIKDFRIGIPDYEEQVEIVLYLNSELSKLDTLKSKTSDTITRLEEYRTALITAAVTGKIDVRGFKLPESATAPDA